MMFKFAAVAMIILGALGAASAKSFPDPITAAKALGMNPDALSNEEMLANGRGIYRQLGAGRSPGASVRAGLARHAEAKDLPAPARRQAMELTCENQDQWMESKAMSNTCKVLRETAGFTSFEDFGEGDVMLCSTKVKANDDTCGCVEEVSDAMSLDCPEDDEENNGEGEEEEGMPCGVKDMWSLDCGGMFGMGMNMAMCMVGALGAGMAMGMSVAYEPTCANTPIQDPDVCMDFENPSDGECACLQAVLDGDTSGQIAELTAVGYVACDNLASFMPSGDAEELPEGECADDYLAAVKNCGLIDNLLPKAHKKNGGNGGDGDEDSASATLFTGAALVLAAAVL